MNTGGNNKKISPFLVVALAGPFQPGAIGALHLAGPGARVLLQKYFTAPLGDEPGKIRQGRFLDREGQAVDQVLVAQLPLEEEFFEITSHGGLRIVQRILDTLQHAGARLVPARELIAKNLNLTDPVAREAYRLLPEAKTALAVKFLLAQAQQGIPAGSKDALKYWPAVEFLLRGATVVLAGPPNAGKSTLLNALARGDHALVADLPGTTRDSVHASVDLGGLPVELIDTAGLGTTDDPLADEVRTKTLRRIADADCAFLLLDAADLNASRRFIHEFQTGPAHPRTVVLLNKIDHPDRQVHLDDFKLKENFPAAWLCLEISALKQTNLDKIPGLLQQALGLAGFDYRNPTVFSPGLADPAPP
jgi:tRNA modification GTPase